MKMIQAVKRKIKKRLAEIKIPVPALYITIVLLVILTQAALTAYITVSAVIDTFNHNVTVTGEYPQWFIEWLNIEYYKE